jgi:hypothetical protein
MVTRFAIKSLAARSVVVAISYNRLMHTFGKQAGAALLLLTIMNGTCIAQQWSAPIFIDSVGRNIGIVFEDSSVGYAWDAQPIIATPYFDAKLHLFRTTDGGNTWSNILYLILYNGDSVYQDIFSPVIFVSCPDNESVFVVIGNGQTFHSVDGTHTWGESWLGGGILKILATVKCSPELVES